MVKDIIRIFGHKLPIEIIRKIIYKHGGFSTPSCRCMKEFLKKINCQFHLFETVQFIKICKTPLSYKYDEWDDHLDTKRMVYIYYDIETLPWTKGKYRRCIFITL
mgnify:CR=1 FL=1